MWQVHLSNGQRIPFELNHSPVAQALERQLKHLRHVAVPFEPAVDNPYYPTRERITEFMKASADRVGVNINTTQLDDQQYLNYLHRVYEDRFDGNAVWLPFHESIHLMELLNRDQMPEVAWIDYRTLGGRLSEPVQDSWIELASSTVRAGDVFFDYAELGKPAYSYWRDNEPDDPARLATLSAPWCNLKARIGIALADRDLHPDNWTDFVQWWEPRQQDYWQRVGVTPRPSAWQQSVFVVGHVAGWSDIATALRSEHRIERITAC